MRGGLTLGPSKRYLGTQPSPIFDRMPLFAPVVWSRYLQWRKLEWCILPNSQRWIQRRCNPSNCENFCRKGQFGWFGEGDPQDEWTCFVQNSKCSRYIQRSLPYNKMKITMSYTELNNNWRPFGLVRSLSNRSNAIFFRNFEIDSLLDQNSTSLLFIRCEWKSHHSMRNEKLHQTIYH